MVRVPPPTGKQRRPPLYGDAAIQTCLTIKGEGRQWCKIYIGADERTREVGAIEIIGSSIGARGRPRTP
ncbi:hypothetical protein BV392_19735 [Rhodovulum sulfidophilum]|nr:hypothetical protein BV392_19735 [Rhodovulum sulfidophilum]